MYLPFQFVEQVRHSVLAAGVLDSDYLQRKHDEFVEKHLEAGGSEWIYDCIALWRASEGEMVPIKKSRHCIRKLWDEYAKHVGFGAGEIIVSLSFDNESMSDFMHSLLMTTTVMEWMKAKRAYKLEESMFYTLCGMKVPAEIYTDVLTKVPFRSFYIDCNASYFCKDAQGIFVTIGERNGFYVYDVCLLIKHKRLIPLYVTFTVAVEGDERAKVALAALDVFRDTLDIQFDEDNSHVVLKEKLLVSFIINFMLYISASNTDVEYTERTARSYKPRKDTKYQMKEVEEFGVGFKYAASISRSRKRVKYIEGSSESDKSQEPVKKRGYASTYRSAHWHHYWVKDEEEGKKLIVRWLDGTFVHGSYDDGRAVVQRVVR